MRIRRNDRSDPIPCAVFGGPPADPRHLVPDPVDPAPPEPVFSEKRRGIRSSMRDAVIRRDGLRCYLCDRDVIPSQVHIDHVIPVARGGQTNIDNLAVTHAHCNLVKRDRLTDKRPRALQGVDCAAAPGPPEPLAVRDRAPERVGAIQGTIPHGNDGLMKHWRPRRRIGNP